ncbi:MAG: ferrochelatase [Pseudomonadota bacterium]|nr:ferrochelatase [Pseudomonadota bacterium]
MKRAVVLFNLGGPDSPDAVRPFLFNLFNDPAILAVPNPLRWVLARLIARRRAKTAREIYGHIGGKSPLLELTQAQANALEGALERNDGETRIFIAMRYWHPMTEAAVRAVREFDAAEVLLLPLYPQFSTATTQSSLDEWHRWARLDGLDVPTYAICCYPAETGLIAAQADLLKDSLDEQIGDEPVRVLFSAHGLPEIIVARGDPYPNQIKITAEAIATEAGLADTDWMICYQSRVGRLKWIGPSLDEALAGAARDGVDVVVLPIAFVSEHSETLVELDIEYRKMAQRLGIKSYRRVPAVGTEPAFIAGLAELVRHGFAARLSVGPGGKNCICSATHPACPSLPT